MPVHTDQTGREVFIPESPRRIISLVPSQTELLYDLGLDEEVTGITKFCVHPEAWFRSKPHIGGTKQLKTALIHQLQPDLIIANKEENVKEQVEALARDYPVWVSDVNSLEEAYAMINAIGMITNREKQAAAMSSRIRESFSGLRSWGPGLKTCYLIWQQPWMTVGGDTFIHTMLEAAGFDNIFKNRKRYPELRIDELKAANCELLLLASEPFPFRQKHVDEWQTLLPGTRIVLVDGEMFSWYGSRLLQAPAYFRKLQEKIAELRE